MVRGKLARAEARASSAEERAAVAHADLLEAKTEIRGMQGQVRRGEGGEPRRVGMEGAWRASRPVHLGMEGAWCASRPVHLGMEGA